MPRGYDVLLHLLLRLIEENGYYRLLRRMGGLNTKTMRLLARDVGNSGLFQEDVQNELQ